MVYLVSGAASGEWIDFAPATVAGEVLQNVKTLLSTAKYSVPLDRELGVEASFLDRPAPDAGARLRVRIAEDIERFEPRAKIRAVRFEPRPSDAASGTVYPVLEIEIKEVAS